MTSLSRDHRLRIMLLGGFDVRQNDCPVVGFTYNKMRALLAYLAMEQEQDHNREFLAELLWGGNDSAVARDNLRRALSSLRRVLEFSADSILFSTTKHTIRFIPNAHIDAKDFIDLALPGNIADIQHHEERIIALYRGEFLAGLSLADSPDFEDWLQIRREAIHRRALSLLEKLSNYHAQMGDYSKALQFALRHTELEPWDEEAHRRVMRFYALNGQNSAALQQYETCCLQLKKELGVSPTEKTRQLYDCVRNGEMRRRSTDTAVPSTAEQRRLAPSGRFSTLSGELRLVSVLYCELTPSPDIDSDELIAPPLYLAQSHCLEIIQQFSGHVVQTHGGGLLAYFGYPQAHEHAAFYAVQAALEISRATSCGIEIRVSVHTGLIITSGDSSMPDTVGKTSKLAIKLNHYSTHNGVAISQDTQRIVSGFFECISLGVQCFTGLAGHLEIFRVIQKSGARTRLDATAQLTPLVGREAETAELMALWEKAEQGKRQVVLIQGEVGIGKSRLLFCLKQRLTDETYVTRELRCFPEFSQSPFHPLIAMFEAVMKIANDDTPEVKFGKMVRYVESHYPESIQDTVPMLAHLLSLPLGEHYRPSIFSPQKQKEFTFFILLAALKALSAQQPVLLVVEDLHWIDPSTLEFLTLLVEQKGEGAILVVFTARPEFVPPWKKGLTSTLTLEPLAGSEVAKIIVAINKDIPAATIRRIVARADGIPLFAEEMAKIAMQDNQLSIPTTLHDLLTMRLDNIGEAKYTAQLAATIGREFDLDLLGMIFPYEPAMLMHTLSVLQNAELILKVNDTICQFKHSLIQEAAYQSQTKAARQTTHLRIAQVLQSDFSNIVATQPELLAQHLFSGGETRQSIQYRIKAGQRAARNSANTEAIEHFSSGLQLLTTLPSDQERDRLEFELQINLGTALIATRGYDDSVDAGQTYTRALELVECIDSNGGFFKAFWGIWLTSLATIGHTHSLKLSEKMLGFAEQDNDVLHLQLAHYAMGNSLFMTGNPNAARIHLEQSMSLYQLSHHEAMVNLSGENIYMSSGSLLSLVLWLQGFPQQASDVSQRTLTSARQLNHPNSLGNALCMAAILNRWMKQIDTTGLLAQEAMGLSDQHGLPFWKGLGSVSYGWVLAMQGRTEGITLVQQCLNAVNAMMSGAKILFLTPLCEALVHQEQFDHALTRVNEALGVVNQKNSRFFESELHRLKGVCLLGISEANKEEAEACFNQALAISREQQAKSLELRTTMSIARLWLRQGKRDDGRCMLEEIYNEFAEGLDTPDLQEAAMLLLQASNT